MGGGKKGGSSGGTTSTSAKPWEGVQPYLKAGYKEFDAMHDAGAPEYFPGSTLAPMDPYTNLAINAQAMRGIMGSPLTTAAQGQLTDTMAGKYLEAGNPYFEGAVNSAIRPIEQNYQTNILPGVDSSFASAGRYGSGAHTDMMGQAYEAMGRNIGDVSSNMAFQNYDAERQRQNEGMLYAPGLANQDYYDINQLGASGSALDAYNQALLNADIERYNYGQNADWIRQQDYLGTLLGTPWGSTSTTKPQQAGAFQSALGGGMQGAGMGSMFGPWGAAIGGVLGAGAGLLSRSDERVKEDMNRVGTLNNGLPVYSFRFKDGGPTQIGVMAQDVEKVKPDAVHDIDGTLYVDYLKAVK